MKKWICLLWMGLLLTGCGAQQTYETLGDVCDDLPVSAQAMEIAVELPREAASAVMEGDSAETLYFADGYTICLQTLEAGDLNKTLQTCTGFPKSKLNVLETNREGYNCYEAVWSCVGETGDQLGRIAVLDDGNYHYTVTVMADARSAGELSEQWQSLFRSLRLIEPGTQVNSGS